MRTETTFRFACFISFEKSICSRVRSGIGRAEEAIGNALGERAAAKHFANMDDVIHKYVN